MLIINQTGHIFGVAAVLMAVDKVEENKRKADHLSPSIEDIHRRYKWDNATLLQQNRFYPLSNSQQVSDAIPSTSYLISNESDPPSTPTTDKPKIKIPPIFLPTSNYQEVTKDLKSITKNNFTTSSSVDKLKINLTTVDDYRNVTEYYNINKVDYYTYQDPTTRPLSVVIKNVPISLTIDEIKDDLTAKGIFVKCLTRLRNKNRQPTLVVAAELEHNESSKQIFKVEHICHAIIRIEPRKNNNTIPQCYRCQRFGHTRNYCSMSYRCVKCLGEHYYKDCPKTQDIPPTCVNCKEHHPANYRGCKYYTEQQKSLNKNNSIPRTRATTANHPQLNLPHISTSSHQSYNPNNANRSYANIIRNGTNSEQASTISNSPILDQILSFIYNIITPHLDKIKTFVFTHILPAFINGSI